MTKPASLTFVSPDADAQVSADGVIACFVPADGTPTEDIRRLDAATGGAVMRALGAPAWKKLSAGETLEIGFPSGLAASSLALVKLDPDADARTAMAAGAALARSRGSRPLTMVGAPAGLLAQIALGAVLRGYEFVDHKTAKEGEPRMDPAPVHVVTDDPDAAEAAFTDLRAQAEGVFLTRDLVNEPANVLTTSEFAIRLEALRDLGMEVEVLEEPELEALGMRTLLAVGQGSESPSKVVVMRWNGGGGEKPFALVGKGVVFDTGGISIKPAAGMEDMTMDMGGAGTVAGVMHTLAKRRAKANVVGLVGLVENMPDGKACRPGDVVRSMKGDTVEIINTDAEGRLVLCDLLWYAQERFAPVAMVDLATLTGAIITALGTENAGVFANDDGLADAFLAAANSEGEGAWRMPLGDAYDKLLKSRVADMKNIGGPRGGSITAAQFLKRFVKDDVPWVHLDIAGVASLKTDSDLAPTGATGWGVRALDRLIRDRFESTGKDG